MAQWSTVSARTDFYGNADWAVDLLSNAEQQACFSHLNSAGIKLALEVGVLKPNPSCQTGNGCFQANKPRWDRAIANGAQIGAFFLDEPFTAVMSGSVPGDEPFAVQQTHNFIGDLRANYPNAKIIEIEAYPFNSANSLRGWIDAMGCCAPSVIPDYFEVDHDLNAGGSSGDLIFLKNETHAVGLYFSMLMAYTNPTSSFNDADWYNSVMWQGSLYHSWGINPDMYHVSAFYHVPRATVPESQTYSFMMSVRALMTAGYIP